MHFVSKLLPTPMKLRWNASIFGCVWQIKCPNKNHRHPTEKTTIFDDVWLLLHECFLIYLQVGNSIFPCSSIFLPYFWTRSSPPFRGHQEQQRKTSPTRVGPRSQRWRRCLEPPFFDSKEFNGKILRVGTSWIIPHTIHVLMYSIFTYIGLFFNCKIW